MEIYLKKTLKIIIYSAFIVTGAILALLPFMKKNDDFSSNYSPDVQEASADIPVVGDPYYTGGSDGGGDDGGGI